VPPKKYQEAALMKDGIKKAALPAKPAPTLQNGFQRTCNKRLLWDCEADKHQNHMVMIVPY
jgi:hypothetical protein